MQISSKRFYRKIMTAVYLLSLGVYALGGGSGGDNPGGGNSGGDDQTFHRLTVVSGFGSGNHLENRVVAILARSPAAGEEFDRWVGDTETVTNVNSSNTFIRMTRDLTVRATYRDIDPGNEEEFQLTVVDGTGSGTHLENELVNIRANAPDAGMEFDRWEGDTATVTNVTASNTFIRMTGNLSVRATYRSVNAELFQLSVVNGTGDANLAEGTLFSINANPPQPGMAFDKWIGDIQHLNSRSQASTSGVMPNQNIEVEATYAVLNTDTANVRILGGSGDGYRIMWEGE